MDAITAKSSAECPNRGRSVTAHLAWRVFWAIMIAGHSLPLISNLLNIGRDAGAPLRAAALILVQAAFVLKLIDVPWLRPPRSRRAYVAVIAGIVLLHGDVARRTLAVEWNLPEFWQSIVIAGSAATLGVLLQKTASHPRANDSVAPRRIDKSSYLRGDASAAARLSRLLFEISSSSQSGYRAPPA